VSVHVTLAMGRAWARPLKEVRTTDTDATLSAKSPAALGEAALAVAALLVNSQSSTARLADLDAYTPPAM
jgi:hypothetical protein